MFGSKRAIMKEIKIETKVFEYESADELELEDRKLLQEARKAAANAYAPYSEFKVGAALLLTNGEIVKGCNQENASYPNGLCGERVAMYAAGANFPGITIKAIAIATESRDKKSREVATPCGECRQTLSEFELRQKQPIKLILAGDAEKVLIVEEGGSLLPLSFKFAKNA